MKCTCCGSEFSENSAYCPQCGQNNEAYIPPQTSQPNEYYYQPSDNYYNTDPYSNNNYNTDPYSNNNSYEYNRGYNVPESSTYGVLAIIFGLLGGWLGLVFGIIGLSKYKEPGHRTMCIVGIVLFIVVSILSVVFLSMFVQYL